MSGGGDIRERSVSEARKIITVLFGQATVNQTKDVLAAVLPADAGPHYIDSFTVGADAVPNDPDGTFLCSLRVRDRSEGAVDVVVNSVDLETLITVASEGFAAAFAAQTAEQQRVIEGGDSLTMRIVNNSAAITTNPNFVGTITLLPLFKAGDPPVKSRSFYTA